MRQIYTNITYQFILTVSLMVVGIFSTTSCTSYEEDAVGVFPFLEVSISDTMVSRTTNSIEVSIKTNRKWDASCIDNQGGDASWVTLTPSSDSKKLEIIIENNNSIELRSAQIFITSESGGQVYDFSLTQDMGYNVETSGFDLSSQKSVILMGYLIGQFDKDNIECGFNIWTDPSKTEVNTVVASLLDDTFEYEIEDLEPGVIYYFEAYAKSEYGDIIVGDTREIDMINIATPTLTTIAASDISTTGVVLNSEVTSIGDGYITEYGFYFGTTSSELEKLIVNYDMYDAYPFNITLSSLELNTTYYFKAYAKNEYGESSGEMMEFKTAEIATPVLTTVAVTDISITGGVLNGEVIYTGDGNIIEYGFYYGTTSSELETVITVGYDMYSAFTFNYELSSLASNITYYFKAYAKNAYGESVGEVMEFKTVEGEASVLTTVAATDISITGGVLNGEVTSIGDGDITEYGFYYGTTSSEVTTVINVGNYMTIPSTFNYVLSNLTSNTTYYFKAYAKNAYGESVGEVMEFKTPEVQLPVLTTVAATDISITGGVLNGEVTSIGDGDITEYGFYYGTTSSEVTTVINVGNYMTIPSTFNYVLSNLTSNTTHYFKAYAKNTYGESVGEVMEFKTPEVQLPVLTTVAATDISITGGTLNGEVTSIGDGNITEYGFYLGTTSSEVTTEIIVGYEMLGTSPFNYEQSSLTSNTTYYFKAYAKNAYGESVGEIMEFTTPEGEVPVLTTVSATDISTTTGALNGEVTSVGDGNVTEYGFYYGTTSSELEKLTVGYDMYNASTFSQYIYDLKSNTTYYFKAYAKNAYGESVGEEIMEFITLDSRNVFDYTLNVTIPNFIDGSTSGNSSINMLYAYQYMVGERASKLIEPTSSSQNRYVYPLLEGEQSLIYTNLKNTEPASNYNIESTLESSSLKITQISGVNGIGSDIVMGQNSVVLDASKEDMLTFARKVASLNFEVKTYGKDGLIVNNISEVLSNINVSVDNFYSEVTMVTSTESVLSGAISNSVSSNVSSTGETQVIAENIYTFPTVSQKRNKVNITAELKNGTSISVGSFLPQVIEANKAYTITLRIVENKTNNSFTLDGIEVVEETIEF